MGEKGDVLASFALAEGGSDKRDAKEKLFEVRRSNGVCWRERGERWKGASSVHDVDGVLCVGEIARCS